MRFGMRSLYSLALLSRRANRPSKPSWHCGSRNSCCPTGGGGRPRGTKGILPPPGSQLLPTGQESCLPLAPFQHSRVFLLKGLWSVNKIECRTAPLFAPWVGELLAATPLRAAAASTGRWLEGAGVGDHRWSRSTFSSHSGFATDFPGTSLPLSGLHVVNEGQAGWEGMSGPFQH